MCSEILEWFDLINWLNEFEIFIWVYIDEENIKTDLENIVNKTI